MLSATIAPSPRATLGTGGGETGTANDMLFGAEFPAIYWLEENGYDVSYLSGIDVATNGSLLLNHKVYMDAGHDEYWTDSQRANVQAAADAGVNLVFLSGNEMFWQTRLAPSIDGSGSANRTLVSYKDTHANRLIDPTGTATGTFMDARFASTGGMSGLPSNSLTGTVFQVNGEGPLGTITIPYGETNLRIWRNTSVANTAPGQTASLVQNLLGFEWDTSPDNGFRPAGLIDLSSTTQQVTGTYLLDYGNTFGDGTATHNLVEYRDAVSGALVFSAGTVFWSWGLSSDHDNCHAAETGCSDAGRSKCTAGDGQSACRHGRAALDVTGHTHDRDPVYRSYGPDIDDHSGFHDQSRSRVRA